MSSSTTPMFPGVLWFSRRYTRRRFGAAGLNRLWSQFTDAGTPLKLPPSGTAWIRAAGTRPPPTYGASRSASAPPKPRRKPRSGGGSTITTDAPTNTNVATLKRSLGLRSVVLFGLAYLAPMIVLGTFGVLALKTHGTVPTGYLLALVALLFTAR